MSTGFRGVRNANGRPKGSLNKTSVQTKKIIEKLVSSELKNIDSLLEQLEPKERVDAIIKLLAYVIPKNSHIEIDIEPPARITPLLITINEPLIAANEH